MQHTLNYICIDTEALTYDNQKAGISQVATSVTEKGSRYGGALNLDSFMASREQLHSIDPFHGCHFVSKRQGKHGCKQNINEGFQCPIIEVGHYCLAKLSVVHPWLHRAPGEDRREGLSPLRTQTHAQTACI